MRILAYTHAYPGPMRHQAGGETSLHDALRYLAGQGHEVVVLVGEPTSCRSYEIDGVSVRTVQTSSEAKGAPMALFPWADVIVTQLKCSYRGSVVAGILGKPVVHYAHNDHPGTKKTLGRYAHIGIYNTHWVKESFRKDGILTPGIVLHPVVEPERYATDRPEANCVTLINLSMGDDGMYDKGYGTFFELARRNPKISFLAVRGAYGNQAYLDLPNIEYMDHQEDIREVYKRTKVLLVPSKYESYGRVAVEAAASGIPSICTPTDGLVEAMGEGGEFVGYGEHDAWNEALHDVLEGYEHSARYNLQRSEFLWKQSQEELEELGLVFQILAAGGTSELYEYLAVR